MAERTEQRELADVAEKQLVAAVSMLGDSSPSTRIAGVYALTDIADNHGDNYKQRVVDILCGYLRTDRVLKQNGEEWWSNGEQSGIKRIKSADGPVESSILQVFRSHLREDGHSYVESFPQEVDGPQLWCDSFFDLHGATFTEPLHLSGAHFKGGASFKGTRIWEHNMEGVMFSGRADFRGTQFYLGAEFGFGRFRFVDFDDASFHDFVQFQSAEITGEASFARATFTKFPVFQSAKFTQPPWLSEAQLSPLPASEAPLLIYHGARFNIDCLRGPAMIYVPWTDSADRTTGLPNGAAWAIFDDQGRYRRDASSDEVAAAHNDAP